MDLILCSHNNSEKFQNDTNIILVFINILLIRQILDYLFLEYFAFRISASGFLSWLVYVAQTDTGLLIKLSLKISIN